ncbi:MAG: PEP-CTERM sorting domain-containing protein [Armatimonadetes bacterium]|nr:PEP-CTERM sorting domain-containing protein [Armatimonadota bacterium]
MSLLSLGAALARANITINPIFDGSITGDAQAAAIEGVINTAIAQYEANLKDNISVSIYFFNMTSGLGQSSTYTINVGYQDLRSHFAADATSGDDTTALAHLPNQVNDPVTGGNGGVDIATAQARAMGYNAPEAIDSYVGLNVSLCNLVHTGGDPTKADLQAVAEHEIDEALGGGGTGSNLGYANNPAMLDLFRYDGNGNRSFNQDPTQHAYFSIDGTNAIDEFNQFGYIGGDYADWIKHTANPEVQDWRATRGSHPDLGPSEWRMLDVSGYDLAVTPEPTSMAALGLGVAALLRKRRK